MIPIIELRGSIPIAIMLFNLPWPEAVLLSIMGNMIPIPFILLLMNWFFALIGRSKTGARFTHWLFARTRRKGKSIEKYEAMAWLSLWAFLCPELELGQVLLQPYFRNQVLAFHALHLFRSSDGRCNSHRPVPDGQSGHPMKPKTIFWLVGENSGDLHAALVLAALQKQRPDLIHTGIGGPRMQKLGLRHLYPFERFAVMGFVEVLKHLPFFLRVQKDIKDSFAANKPDLVILVDYPGLNMRIARLASLQGIPVLYFICPSFGHGNRKEYIN